MRKLLSLFILMSSFANAADMTCVETAKSKKENGNEKTIIINLANDGKSMWIMVKPDKGGKSTTAIAKRDDHNSYKDTDADSTYNLDEEYDRKAEARFVTSNGSIASSDGDSIIFIEKSILKGEPGKLSLSGGQANDGDSGDAWLWGRIGEWKCK